jgi:hypothetical protein
LILVEMVIVLFLRPLNGPGVSNPVRQTMAG